MLSVMAVCLRRKKNLNNSGQNCVDVSSNAQTNSPCETLCCESKISCGSYFITNFDGCRLSQVVAQNNIYCELCETTTQKKVGNFCCSSCNVTCCLECYDSHRLERMQLNLGDFKRGLPENSDVTVSEDGQLITHINRQDSSVDEVNCFPDVHENNFLLSNSIVNDLKCQHNAKTEFLMTNEQKLSSLFFQDHQMSQFYCYYPEFLTIDVTCEIVVLELTLYSFISEDANGHCEIVAAGFLETESSLTWLCEVFKKHNPKWQQMKVLLADKHITDTEPLKISFDRKDIFISAFHATQSFKHSILNLDFDLSKSDDTSALKCFENILISRNESEFETHLDELNKLPQSLVTYFKESWLPEKNLWGIALKFKNNLFLDPMNKFLSYIKRKLKISLNTQKNLEKIIKRYFIVLHNLRKEHFEKISAVFQTVTVTSHVKSPQSRYSRYLTCYAGNLVINQINAVSDVKNLQKVSSGRYSVSPSTSDIHVTPTCCSCYFNMVLSLPCSHIFAVRKFLSLPLFSENFCSSRWVAKSYQSIFLQMRIEFDQKKVTIHEPNEVEGSLRKYFEVAGQLLPQLTQTSDSTLSQRCITLSNLSEAWKYNIKVSVKTVESSGLSESNREINFDSSFSIDHLKTLYGLTADEQVNSEDDFSSVSLCSEHSDDEILKYIESSSKNSS